MGKLKTKPSLATVNPSVAAQWHPTKNGDLTPQDVSPKSSRKVWWLCENDHDSEAFVFSRVAGYRCGYCTGRDATPENNLAVLHPEVAAEWHPTKNGDLSPSDVVPKSGRKVWWRCAGGHEWEAFVYARRRGQRCGYCTGKFATPENNLAVLYPAVAAEWHPTKNGDLSPSAVRPGSTAKHHWICSNGHEWATAVSNRTRGRGCGYCSGRYGTPEKNLVLLYPDIAAQWHPTKNGDLSPYNVAPMSDKKVWWRCESGHEWEAVTSSRVKGNGCGRCSGRILTPENNLTVTNPELLVEWDHSRNGDLLPEHFRPGSNCRIAWKCHKGHRWVTEINQRAGKRRSGCPDCVERTSKPERALQTLLSYVMDVDTEHPSIVAGGRKQACDIVVPDRKLVVEYDGCYWHKDKEAHDLAKTLALNDAGWKVIRVRETPLEKLTGRDVLIKPNDVDAAFKAICRMLRISAKDRDHALLMSKAALN